MKTFTINLTETVLHKVDVQAESFDEALDLTRKACKDGTIEDWAVVEKDSRGFVVPNLQSGRE